MSTTVRGDFVWVNVRHPPTAHDQIELVYRIKPTLVGKIRPYPARNLVIKSNSLILVVHNTGEMERGSSRYTSRYSACSSPRQNL